MTEKTEQELREEGFKDCERYITSFQNLECLKKEINRQNGVKESIPLNYLDLFVEIAIDYLNDSTKRIKEIEIKYDGGLKKSSIKILKKDYQRLLEDFGEAHKKLAEYVAYSRIEKAILS